MNFCVQGIGTTISCDQVQSDGNEAENLLASAYGQITTGFGARPRGFLTDYFVRPPVTIRLKFSVCIEISDIVISRKFGAQTSSAFTIQTETCTAPYDDEVSKRVEGMEFPKHLVAKEFLDENVTHKVVFQNKRYLPRPPFSLLAARDSKSTATSSDEASTFSLRHPSGVACHRVIGLEITILRTTGSSVAGLGGLEVWGQPCRRCPQEVVNRKLTQWLRLTRKPKLKREAPPEEDSKPKQPRLDTSAETLVISEEFLDPITQEIMCQPIRLPCGIAVDASTLEKYYKAEATWGRPANDPFTGQAYNDSVKPLADGSLKTRIDLFLTRNADNPSIRCTPRTLGVKPKALAPQIRIMANKIFPNGAPSTSTSTSAQIDSGEANKSAEDQASVLVPTSMEERLQQELAKVLGNGSSYVVKPSNEPAPCPVCIKCSREKQNDRLLIFYCHPSCTHVLICRSCMLKLDKQALQKCPVCLVEWSAQQLQRSHSS